MHGHGPGPFPVPSPERLPFAHLAPRMGMPLMDPYQPVNRMPERVPVLRGAVPAFFVPPEHAAHVRPLPPRQWMAGPPEPRRPPVPAGARVDADFVRPPAVDPRLRREGVDDRQSAAQGERGCRGPRREPARAAAGSSGGVSNSGRTEPAASASGGKARAGGRSEPQPSQQQQQQQSPAVDTTSATSTAADFVRSSPADLYFSKEKTSGNVVSTKRQQELEATFDSELLQRAAKIRSGRPAYVPAPRQCKLHFHSGCSHSCGGNGGGNSSSSDGSSDGSDSSDGDADDSTSNLEAELRRKREHPERLHKELWFNEQGEANDGPLCRCSRKHRASGIRHGVYPGERAAPLCAPDSNNLDRLHHYKVVISPAVNFTLRRPTKIAYDGRDYAFEGFSLLAHEPLACVPDAKVVRFNIEYTIKLVPEPAPENFSARSLDLLADYVLTEILELVDLEWWGHGDCRAGCRQFHVMPRFARALPENGREVLSLNEVLRYLLGAASLPLVDGAALAGLLAMSEEEWRAFVDEVQGTVVTAPGSRPSSVRVDQLDRAQASGASDVITYPVVVHFGIRPDEVCYAGDPAYQKLWKEFVKLKHLLANKPKMSTEDRHALQVKEDRLAQFRSRSTMRRDVAVELSSEGFLRTGLGADVCQHALVLPVVVAHVRFHRSLVHLERALGYEFRDRQLLQLCLTHPSHTRSFGTNPDHVRNSLANCGVRKPEYGDKRALSARSRKRGISTLLSIMSRMGCDNDDCESDVTNNERLEFLGDAVLELVASVHLYFLFPNLEEGGLATYRAALVQNQHLSVLADRLRLQDFMLYAHGPDLCHDLDLRHAMANCFEALMAALYLDGGLEAADVLFGRVLFEFGRSDECELLLAIWQNLPLHPLQEDLPDGDAHLIDSSPVLMRMREFQESIGVKFDHIRLLARAMTHRNCGYNILTLGHNQRLEFLGDTVLQLIVSDYLYRHFPSHHEGHLSLLRSSLVSNKTQAVVHDDLCMSEYVIKKPESGCVKTKEKADFVEALIGALYVDGDLEICRAFCDVCFFPRLRDFIMNQDWNDAKSQLQQCCLTLRRPNSGEPEVPTYRMIECTGPSNNRQYTVAVYFQGERLAKGHGASIQLAEMDAAAIALRTNAHRFPQFKQPRLLQGEDGRGKGAKRARNDPSSGSDG